jgi:hypothetical protein
MNWDDFQRSLDGARADAGLAALLPETTDDLDDQ